MEKTTSILRIATLVALFGLGLVGIMGAPEDNTPYWFLALVLTKVLGLAALAGSFGLYERWNKVDAWLMAYDKWCKTIAETPMD